MLSQIKNLIEAVTEIKSVSLADDIPEAMLENLEPDPSSMPSVVLYFGDYEYDENETKMYVRQQSEKKIVALLFIRVTDFDDVHDKVLRAVLGYTHNQKHTGMFITKSTSVLVRGPVMVRRLEFATQTLISQT